VSIKLDNKINTELTVGRKSPTPECKDLIVEYPLVISFVNAVGCFIFITADDSKRVMKSSLPTNLSKLFMMDLYNLL
jgi:hypothetical protein